MKSMILFLVLSLTSGMAAAAKDCSAKAESYLVGVGYTQPATFVGALDNGWLVYQVRSNQNRGDASYEVVVDNRCQLISTRVLWSE